jgi:hypothetical protein
MDTVAAVALLSPSPAHSVPILEIYLTIPLFFFQWQPVAIAFSNEPGRTVGTSTTVTLQEILCMRAPDAFQQPKTPPSPCLGPPPPLRTTAADRRLLLVSSRAVPT